jgi:hypothetical protein
MVDRSRRADPPWDKEPSAVRILIDGRRERWLWESSSHYPGLGAFGSRRVFTDTGGFEIDIYRTGHGTEVMPVDAEGAARARLEMGRFIPGVLLEQALSSPDGPSVVGRRESAEGRVDVVRFNDHRGREVHLLIHSATGSLLGYELHRPDPVWGDAFDSVAFTGLHRSGGLGLPERRAEFTNGALVRELLYRVSVGAPVPDSLFSIPEGYDLPGAGTAHHHMDVDDGDAIAALAPGAPKAEGRNDGKTQWKSGRMAEWLNGGRGEEKCAAGLPRDLRHPLFRPSALPSFRPSALPSFRPSVLQHPHHSLTHPSQLPRPRLVSFSDPKTRSFPC